MQPINLYNIQHIQQIYQSQIMVSSVQGENRMKDVVREIPRFGDQLARAAEPVVRKTLPAVEQLTDERSALPSRMFRAMIEAPQVGRSETGAYMQHSISSKAGQALDSYISAMTMGQGPADYIDHNHGTVFDMSM